MRKSYVIFFLSFMVSLSFLAPAYSSLDSKFDKKGRVYWHGNNNDKVIALTFDDGPSHDTEKILAVLQQYDIKATFFVVGMNVEKLPDVLRSIIDDGHVIGNHSYSHPDMFMESPAQIRQQLQKTEEVVRRIGHIEMSLFRPPYGVENPWVYQAAEKEKYTVVKWSVSGTDWMLGKGDQIARRIIARVHNGSIIVLHDGCRLKDNPHCQATIDALTKIIPALEEKGYRFVTVPELLQMKQKGLLSIRGENIGL